MSTEITSKYRNPKVVFWVFGVLIAMNLGTLLFGKGPLPGKIMSLVIAVLLVLIIYIARHWQKVNRIVIDRAKRTIRWGKFFSKGDRVYSFNEFQTCKTSFERNKNGRAKVLRLMKNGYSVKKISGFTYANIDEMEQVIGEMMAKGRS